MNAYRRCNKYIDETMPWLLFKDPNKHDRLATIIYNLVESIRIITVYLQAYLPSTADSIFKQINSNLNTYDSVDAFGNYESGTILGEAEVLFKRIDKENK